MSNTDNPSPEKSEATGTPTPTPPPATGDVESHVSGEPLAGVSSILSKWGREDKMEKGSLSLRGVGLVFSFLAFIVMASNDHGGWKRFEKYQDYRYVLAIAILSFLYTGGQVFRQVHEIFTGKETFNRRNLALFNFVGDQICAYFLISAASAAVPATRTFTEYIEKGYVVDSIFRDSSAAAISMEFLAFVSLALSAVFSGHKLSHLSYI